LERRYLPIMSLIPVCSTRNLPAMSTIRTALQPAKRVSGSERAKMFDYLAKKDQAFSQVWKSPHLWLAMWLLFLGTTILWHVVQTKQPPTFDALTYFQKAKNCWENLYQLKLKNPLNVDPTFRPPGTILMSYPLGFDSDFHAFYFRSVYFPIICFVAAIYLAGYKRSLQHSTKWTLALFAICLSSLPTFYHF